MAWQEVDDQELVQRLERRRRSQAEEFLKTADRGKWYRIPWSRSTIKRAAKRLGISVEVKAREDGLYCRVL